MEAESPLEAEMDEERRHEWLDEGEAQCCPECKGTRPMPGEEAPAKKKVQPAEGAEAEQATAPAEDVHCEQCGASMVLRHSRRGPFYGCSNYPKCKGTRQADGEAAAAVTEKKPVQVTDIACEKCGKPMVIRSSRRGPFLGCSGYPRCKTARPLPEDAAEVPPSTAA